MKVFVAGSRAMQGLNDDIQTRLSSILSIGATVLVGDAKGADMLVQTYLKEQGYLSVIVYASNGKVRNNVSGWPVAEVPTKLRAGSFEFYAEKDRKMAEDADYGFMIWDGQSRGTLNDTIMLTDQGKSVLVYFLPHQRFYSFKTPDALNAFLSNCGEETLKLYDGLKKRHRSTSALPFAMPAVSQQQISLFDNMQ